MTDNEIQALLQELEAMEDRISALVDVDAEVPHWTDVRFWERDAAEGAECHLRFTIRALKKVLEYRKEAAA